MRRTCALLCLLLLFFVVPVKGGQASKKPMTNADVVKLVKAGIPSDTIVIAIQHGRTNFDTSPDAIIELSKSGATKAIIDAMLTGNSKSDSPSTPPGTAVATALSENLNNEFAKAGLRALKAIDGEDGSGSDGSVPRETQTLIDAADSEARLDQERAVITLLNKLYMLRLNINRNRAPFMLFASDLDADGVAKLRQTADSTPPTTDMIKRQVACSGALDFAIRNRSYTGTPEQCIDLSDPGLPFQAK